VEQKVYTYDEAVQASREYFGGDEMAAKVWVSKYALKDSQGTIFERTPADMHRRLAKELARIERKYPNPLEEDKIFELLDEFRYLVPQGGPMTGIGNDFQIASLSNCFVVGNEGLGDSYGGILKIDEEQVQLMKRRGGVGHDLSGIRPKGSPVMNSALTSTGIVPFMERYSNSTREVAQDGRRGALMLSISIQHPDAEDFIDAKLDTTRVTGANVSVRIDDAFMQAALSGQPYEQQYPVGAANPRVRKAIDAQRLWKKIVYNAWKSAEPGILFWDTIIRESIPDCYADLGYRTVSTNPCGEIPLCPYDSCRLLAINLYSYVDKPFTAEAHFDEELFREHVGYAQRLMDDIIDLELEKIAAIRAKIESDPEPDGIKRVEWELWEKIEYKSRRGRRTGLGITAEGDMLAALGIRYGTPEATQIAEHVQKVLALAAYGASVSMAEERGAFEIYDSKREEANPFIARIREAAPELYSRMVAHGRRNIALLTIAPTGTVSLMTQTTSGIEPVFMPYYRRRRKVNSDDKNAKYTFKDKNGDYFEEFTVFHPKFLVWLETNGYAVDEVKGRSLEFIDSLVSQSPYHKATANEIDWEEKVRMQGAVQRWVDHSISVTVNLPKDVSEEAVAKVYETAWSSGCKGCTVYRDGSRDGVLVAADDPAKSEFPRRRPRSLECDVIRFHNREELWIAFVGLYGGQPYEIFTGRQSGDVLPIPDSVVKGKIVKVKTETGSRYDFQYEDSNGYPNVMGGLSHQFNKEFWNYAKLLSGVLRNRMPIVDVVNLVHDLQVDDECITTWKSGVERALQRYVPDGTVVHSGEVCPSCGSDTMVYQEGCLHCANCGSSKCS
jgi:hypothetical protein